MRASVHKSYIIPVKSAPLLSYQPLPPLLMLQPCSRQTSVTWSPSVFFLCLFWMRTFGGKWQRCLTGRMPFLSPNKQCRSTEANSRVLKQLEKNILSSCTTRLLCCGEDVLFMPAVQRQLHIGHTCELSKHTRMCSCSKLLTIKHTLTTCNSFSP